MDNEIKSTEEPVTEAEISVETPVESNTEPVVPADKILVGGIEYDKPDQTVFNCKDCQGLGLKTQYTLCPTCNGTGKVI